MMMGEVFERFITSSSKFQDTDILAMPEEACREEKRFGQEVLLRMGLVGLDSSSIKSSNAVQLSNHK